MSQHVDASNATLTARLLRMSQWPRDLLRQTPGGRGVWGNVKYIVDDAGEADYVIVHYLVNRMARVKVPRSNVWLIMGEPPNEQYDHHHICPRWAARVYGNDARRAGASYRLTYSPVPWLVDRTYDELKRAPIPWKRHGISWVTSDRRDSHGHLARMAFCDKVQTMDSLELYGRGFRPIADKWDAIAPFKYSIAFENFSNSHYWTEKVQDCFLAWSMPIYFGCTRLHEYFPRESFIQLDPDSPDPNAELRQIMESGIWEKSIDAIAEARRRVLDDYNMFEFITREIVREEAVRPAKSKVPARVTIRNHVFPFHKRIWYTELKPWCRSLRDNARSLHRRARVRPGSRESKLA